MASSTAYIGPPPPATQYVLASSTMRATTQICISRSLKELAAVPLAAFSPSSMLMLCLATQCAYGLLRPIALADRLRRAQLVQPLLPDELLEHLSLTSQPR